MIKQILSIFLMLAVIIALSGLGYMRYRENKVVPAKEYTQNTADDVRVVNGSSQNLNKNISASNLTPESSSPSTIPLQSNVNINDPSVASSPLVQSLKSGGN